MKQFQVDSRLQSLKRKLDMLREGTLTALLPAHSMVPSLATVTEATETSSSGMS